MCVADFSCSACFFLFYYALVLIFWLCLSFILRFGGVFTRVYVTRVCFICAVRVFRVLFLLCCVFVVPFVLFAILLPFASLDDYSQSVYMGLLRVVVCLCVCLYFVVPFVFLVVSSVVFVLFCFFMTLVSCVCRLCVFLLSVFLSV